MATEEQDLVAERETPYHSLRHPTMFKPLAVSLLLLVELALAHGGHEHAGPESGETIQQYAQRHVGVQLTPLVRDLELLILLARL